MKTVKHLQTELKTELKLEKSLSSVQLKTYLSQIGVEVVGLSDSLTDDQYLTAREYITRQHTTIATTDNTPVEQESQSTVNSLTFAEKQSLVKIQAVQMNIELSDTEILQIVDSNKSQETDLIDYLVETRSLIQSFIDIRNQELQQTTQRIVNDIANIINSGHELRERIIGETNQTLQEIVNQASQSTDYKSTYRDRLESIRETLKTIKVKSNQLL